MFGFKYHHQSGRLQKWQIDFWHSDDIYKASLHFHWNWFGTGHWLCIFLPEWIK